MAGLATVTVMLVAGIILVVGAITVGSSFLGGPDAARVCPHCGHANSRKAVYCARCGRRL